MSKHQWSVTRQGESPKVVRHYKWLTKLYSFVLRNSAMFQGGTLTIHDHGEKVVDLTYAEVRTLAAEGLKETEARKRLLAIKEVTHG